MSRTLVVTNDFPPRRGGIETFVRQLCGTVPPEDVVVYTARMPGDAAYDAELPFTVVRDPSAMLLPTPAVGRRVEEVLRREGCDRVVFGASAPLGLLARRLRLAGATHLAAITHGHEVWWARLPVSRTLLRRIGDDVDVLTFVSGYCRDRIAPALSPAGRARLRRLSPWVERQSMEATEPRAMVRARWGVAADAPVALCVARLVRRKGQDELVRVWPEVRTRVPGAMLVLVGDGPQRRRLRRLTRWYGVTDAVVLAGSVPASEVPNQLHAADVFAMPARTRRGGLEVEAFGIVFLEAAAAGLPLVYRGGGGVEEAVALARAGGGEPAALP